MDINVNLLEKVESGKGLFAVESISLIYNALTSILILILYPRMDHPADMLLERAGIGLIILLLMLIYQRYSCKLTGFLRVAFQLGLLAYWYPDTYEFNRLFPNLDHIFARAEQALFGCQPAIEFGNACSSVWFSEAFNMGYFAYYPMIFGIVLF